MTSEEQQRLERIAQAQPPFAQTLGVRITHVEPDRVEAEVEVTAAMGNRNGVLHGGAISGLTDNIAGTATFVNLVEGQSSSTIESKINFFRAVAIGEIIRLIAEPLHKGRKTQVWQIKVLRGDGKVAAIATQTQIILESFER